MTPNNHDICANCGKEYNDHFYGGYCYEDVHNITRFTPKQEEKKEEPEDEFDFYVPIKPNKILKFKLVPISEPEPMIPKSDYDRLKEEAGNLFRLLSFAVGYLDAHEDTAEIKIIAEALSNYEQFINSNKPDQNDRK